MKKIIALFLCFAMVFSCTATIFAENDANGDFSFVIDGENAFITGYGGSEAEVVIPETINGYNVLGISSGAFTANNTVTSITIPKTVKEIGTWAFIYCGNLLSITVDEENESFASIDGVLFNKDKTTLVKYPAAKATENYEVPTGVEVIAETAFSTAQIKSITLPETLAKIERYAFYHTQLESLTMPNSVTEVGDSAFFKCEDLKNITFSDNVEILKEAILANCFELETVKLPENLKKIERLAFAPSNKIKELVLPQSLEVIEDMALMGCTKITKLSFPDSMTRIGKLSSNLNLSDVHFGSKVEEITDDFWNCARYINNITVAEDNASFIVENGILFTKDKKEILNFFDKSVEEYTIPDGVEKIGACAFYSLTALKKVNIPETVTYIGDHAFSNSCLTEITIPDSVKTIDKAAFSATAELATVKLPNGLTKIEDNAFAGCDNLKSIEIPEGVEVIGASAFARCDHLESVKLPDSLKVIEDDAFCDCQNLSEIQFPDSLVEIGDRAFETTKLTIKTLPENLKTIGDRAFGKCFYITEMTIPDSVVSIGDHAFAHTAIEKLSLGKGVGVLDSSAFKWTALKEVVIPASVRIVGESVFSFLKGKIIFEGEPPVNYTDSFHNPNDEIYDDSPEVDVTLCYYEAYEDEWEAIAKNSQEKFKKLDGGKKFLRKGDANKDYALNSKDLAAVQKGILNGETIENADITGDGRVNSLDISAMQRAIQYGSQYVEKETDKKPDAVNGYSVINAGGYAYDEYKDQGIIVVNSRSGFEFLPEKYNDEYFEEKALVLKVMPKDVIVNDFDLKKVIINDSNTVFEVTNYVLLEVERFVEQSSTFFRTVIIEIEKIADGAVYEINIDAEIERVKIPIC